MGEGMKRVSPIIQCALIKLFYKSQTLVQVLTESGAV